MIKGYIWKLTNKRYGELTIKAPTRLEALMAGARKWGEPRWEKISAQTKVEMTGKIIGEENETKHDSEGRRGTGDSVQLGENESMAASGTKPDVPHPERRKAQRDGSKAVPGRRRKSGGT